MKMSASLSGRVRPYARMATPPPITWGMPASSRIRQASPKTANFARSSPALSLGASNKYMAVTLPPTAPQQKKTPISVGEHDYDYDLLTMQQGS